MGALDLIKKTAEQITGNSDLACKSAPAQTYSDLSL